jgi:DNA-directed RNA polymerase
MLSILVETTTINNKGREEPAFRVETKWTPKKKTTSYVVLNENLYRMFTEDELVSWAASTTRHTPMIVPPTEWTGPQKGGYRWLEADLMRTHGSQVQREALQHGDLSLVYDGLNILGKTAWRINQEILDIAQTCWNENIPIGDIPSRIDLEVPPEPTRPDRIPPEVYADRENPEAKEAMATNQSYRESMHKRQRVLQKNMDLRSLRCSARLKLNQAEQFKNFERIYFPYNLDFRGRACKYLIGSRWIGLAVTI